MKPEPIRIRASKRFALIFIPLILTCPVWGFVTVLLSANEWWIKVTELAMALFFVAVALFGVYTLISRRFIYVQDKRNTNSDNLLKILITDDEIICSYATSNKTERIRWDEIDLVQVLTTDEGPAVCDVFFVLQNSATQEGVVLPQDREETKEVFEKVNCWPGFDNENFIPAMSSSENKWFKVWAKKFSDEKQST